MRILTLNVHIHGASTEEQRKKWSCSCRSQLNIIFTGNTHKYLYQPKSFYKHNKHLTSIALQRAMLASEYTGIHLFLHSFFFFCFFKPTVLAVINNNKCNKLDCYQKETLESHQTPTVHTEYTMRKSMELERRPPGRGRKRKEWGLNCQHRIPHHGTGPGDIFVKTGRNIC